jgi:flagellar assembly protein FliH
MTPSKIIPSETFRAYQNGATPIINIVEKITVPPPTAQDTEQVKKDIYEEAYAEGLGQGKKKGYAAGLAEIQAQADRLMQIISTLHEPLAQLDDQMEKELAALSIAIARQIVRRELKTDPGQIVAVVREAVASLPVGSRNVNLHLHPEDAALVRNALSLTGNDKTWRVVEDPLVMRGGCNVVTDISRIDATLDTRIAAIAAAILGGGRDHDKK